MRKRKAADQSTIDPFERQTTPGCYRSAGLDFAWHAHRFLLNLEDRKVKDTVLPDLEASTSPLLASGYTSLCRLIDFAAEWAGRSHARLLIVTNLTFAAREP